MTYCYCAYLRISLDRFGRALGVADQRRIIEAWATGQGITILHFFCDNSLSAAKEGVVRKDFLAMVGAVDTGLYNAVVVVEPSRISRIASEAGAFGEMLTRAGGWS